MARDHTATRYRPVERGMRQQNNHEEPFKTGNPSPYVVTGQDAAPNQTVALDRDALAAELSEEILRVVFRHRRLRQVDSACAANPCSHCLNPHLGQVKRAILAGQPVHFILPAFPVKSPSRRKTLGPLPDLAEELALSFLQSLCDEVAAIYAPGARITICSDGRVFSDIVGVTDEDVTRYGDEIAAMIDGLGARSIDLFNLEDFFDMGDFAAMRAHLADRYAEPLEAIRERTRQQDEHRAFFCGVLRFLLEDRLGQDTGKTKSRLQKECKGDAYQMIQRSNAWSRLVGECFPGAVRLSIHPHEVHSDKLGILLSDTPDAWLTPWHSAALKSGSMFRLIHREEAEALGAALVHRSGRPSHFEIAA